MVELDESCFIRRKHSVSDTPDTQWVFGGIDSQTKQGFLVAVPRRDAETLLPVIQRFIEPHTTIVSEQWAAYNSVGGDLGYKHLSVNYGYKFVDPVTHATTNDVKTMWWGARERNKKENGTARQKLDSYLMEFMWRQQFNDDPFQNLLSHIREVYPV